MDKFLLWSARAGGWMTAHGTYMSDHNMAERVDFTEALTRCRVHYNQHGHSFGLLPIPEAMIEEILK